MMEIRRRKDKVGKISEFAFLEHYGIREKKKHGVKFKQKKRRHRTAGKEEGFEKQKKKNRRHVEKKSGSTSSQGN